MILVLSSVFFVCVRTFTGVEIMRAWMLSSSFVRYFYIFFGFEFEFRFLEWQCFYGWLNQTLSG